MKMEFWLIGKTSYNFVEEGVALYEKRLKHYVPFEIVTLPHPKGQLNAEQIKQKEAEAVLKKLNTDDFLILFDERGKTFTSEKFATYMESLLSQSHRRVIWLIGGAYGFTPEVYSRANAQVSLSSMTFSHQLIRVCIMEQFYRAMAILNNEPYHHA